MRQGISFISVFLTALLLPTAAFAYATLACVGPTPVGHLYDTTASCAGITGLENVFSGLVCNYEIILDAVLSRVYCGMQFSLRNPLALALTIYVIIFGIQISLGYIQMAGREVLMRLLKICLVWGFATQSIYGIGIAYNFFNDAANQGVAWALKVLMPQAVIPPGYAERVAFYYMDALIYDAITGPLTEGRQKLTGLIAMMAWVYPPVFMAFVYFTLKTVGILVRALLTYLVGISAIAFLIAMSPIFLSLALFQPTYRFFDDWLRYIISFTLQIILVFMCIGLWMITIQVFGNFFAQLINIIVPIDDKLMAGQVGKDAVTWGLCSHVLNFTPMGPVLSCVQGWENKPRILPTTLIKDQTFLFFMTFNLLAVCIIAYAYDTLLKNMPNLARQLAGPSYAPQIAGGHGLGSVKYPGMSQIRGMAERGRAGFLNEKGGLFGRLGGIMDALPWDRDDEGERSREISERYIAKQQRQEQERMARQRQGPGN